MLLAGSGKVAGVDAESAGPMQRTPSGRFITSGNAGGSHAHGGSCGSAAGSGSGAAGGSGGAAHSQGGAPGRKGAHGAGACVRAAAASRGRRRSACMDSPTTRHVDAMHLVPVGAAHGTLAKAAWLDGSTHGQWPACQCVACSERRPFPDHHTHACTHLPVRLPCCSWAG